MVPLLTFPSGWCSHSSQPCVAAGVCLRWAGALHTLSHWLIYTLTYTLLPPNPYNVKRRFDYPSHTFPPLFCLTLSPTPGREAPGKAYRLYTEASFRGLPPTTPPEITRVNLGSVVLQLKVGGVDSYVCLCV